MCSSDLRPHGAGIGFSVHQDLDVEELAHLRIRGVGHRDDLQALPRLRGKILIILRGVDDGLDELVVFGGFYDFQALSLQILAGPGLPALVRRAPDASVLVGEDHQHILVGAMAAVERACLKCGYKIEPGKGLGALQAGLAKE